MTSGEQLKSRRSRKEVGGPGLGGTDPQRPAQSLRGRAQKGLPSKPSATQQGAEDTGTSLRPGAALPQSSPRTRGRGAGQRNTPPPPPDTARPPLAPPWETLQARTHPARVGLSPGGRRG